MTNYSAEILEALGNHDAAANLRWAEKRDPAQRRDEEIERLWADLQEARAERDHAMADADLAWKSMCKQCQGKRGAA